MFMGWALGFTEDSEAYESESSQEAGTVPVIFKREFYVNNY